MNVSEAIASRISCRAFLPTPVAAATVYAILDAARQAPSGGNLQPGYVDVLSGAPLAAFKAEMTRRFQAHPQGEPPDYDIYPKALGEPYRSRRFRCGEDLYATLDIAREDRAGRLSQFARNLQFFGAPVGLFFSIGRQMGIAQWGDLGIYLQSVMLLAREHSLHSCAQEYWALWPRSVAELLPLPPERTLYCGMALGYMDEQAPVNRLRTERAPLEASARFSGF